MMHTHVDDRVLAEMSAEDRLDRIRRILETLEARDEPRFSFYDHEHEREREQGLSSTR
jgi:regulator of sigma D